MKKIFIFIIIFIGIIPACYNLSPKEQELQNTLDKTLNLTQFETVQKKNIIMPFEEFRQDHRKISVVYLENGCTPCFPKFIEWQNKIDSINSPDDYTVLFIIKGESYGEFMANVLDIEYVEDKYYTIMDPEGKFLENNKNIPRWIIESSILIGPENKIKMVGAPFATPEMTKLFHETCKE